ncbi:hypothetical protein CFOL_v3_16010 [Cephalotus follicularis]|uniref:Uncharacterized protein n=1 Tax=Cephalotus follicularis TaxID=3775 RepID=A0A1Q3BXB6_CEPFO|nr:hypothetical protein CFOL_v3_16010 [Cephalotus follicularis]
MKNMIHFGETLDNLIVSDDTERFVSIIKEQLSYDYPRPCLNDPHDLMRYIEYFEAIKCATALVGGETGLTVDVNVADESGAFPLHFAAANQVPGLIMLYLQHGADIDVRCPTHHPSYGGMLPFNVAISYLRRHPYFDGWTPKQPIFTLIVRLCLPKMRQSLDTVELLMRNTNGVEEETYHYAKKRDIIELAVLLMAGCSRNCYKFFTIHQVIAAEISQPIGQDVQSIARDGVNSLTGILKDNKRLTNHALLLLEVFEKAGDAINAYLQLERTHVPVQQVANEVASLLQEAGYVSKHQDIDMSDVDLSDIRQSTLDKLRDIVKRRHPEHYWPFYAPPRSIQPDRNNEDKLLNMTAVDRKVSNPKAEFMSHMPSEPQRLASLLQRDVSTPRFDMQSVRSLHSGKDGLSDGFF